MTVIYPSPIFGPVHSRRLGVSLGINLYPPMERYVHLIASIVNVVLMQIIALLSPCLLVRKYVKLLKPA